LLHLLYCSKKGSIKTKEKDLLDKKVRGDLVWDLVEMKLCYWNLIAAFFMRWLQMYKKNIIALQKHRLSKTNMTM
jgi:preprotein translocase subunit Sec63